MGLDQGQGEPATEVGSSFWGVRAVKNFPGYEYDGMTDKQLEFCLELETKRSKRSMCKKVRAIAHKNVDRIIAEQTRRHEGKFGLV